MYSASSVNAVEVNKIQEQDKLFADYIIVPGTKKFKEDIKKLK